jgi:hypothetical protein
MIDPAYHDLQIAMAALQRGEMSVDDVLVIARPQAQNARTLAYMVLQDNSQQSLLNDSPAARMIDFLWKLFGFASFRTAPLQGPTRQLFDNYLYDELRERPDQFSDDDLRFLTLANQFGEYAGGLARKVQTSRVAGKAGRLKQSPEELSRDVAEVRKQVSLYKFNDDLNGLLDKVEECLGIGDSFDQAAMLKHLRTFFEKLHEDIGKTLRQAKPATVGNAPLGNFSQAINFLQRHDLVTLKMEALGKAIYGVLSNEGVHAIKAEREYVRLCRNMVAEYALVLFFELNRRLNE